MSENINNEMNLEELEEAAGGKGGKTWHTYTVVKGDTLIRIAERFGIPSYRDIVRWNNIKDPSLIIIGQKLKLYY